MANGWMDFIYLNTLMHVGFQLCQNYFSFPEPKIQMTNFFEELAYGWIFGIYHMVIPRHF